MAWTTVERLPELPYIAASVPQLTRLDLWLFGDFFIPDELERRMNEPEFESWLMSTLGCLRSRDLIWSIHSSVLCFSLRSNSADGTVLHHHKEQPLPLDRCGQFPGCPDASAVFETLPWGVRPPPRSGLIGNVPIQTTSKFEQDQLGPRLQSDDEGIVVD